MSRLITAVLLIIFCIKLGSSQPLFVPSDTLNKTRLYSALSIGAVTYTGFSVALYNTWYKKYDRESFHFFNDAGEWLQMDKIGHFHTAYFQGVLCYKGMKWTGADKNKSIITGLIAGTLFQSTIEVMDGFSSKWGFSLSDMGANIAGSATFGLQQYYWDDQRISIKMSSISKKHDSFQVVSSDGSSVMDLSTRAEDLFGHNYFERLLKDYNTQTYWASINVHSFLAEGNRWPKWLNVAIGYGAENMYGGFENSWEKNEQKFILNDVLYPRYRQFYIGFDLDLPKLNPKNHFLKTLCSTFNIFKIPSPALEINTRGQVVFHLLQ